MNPYEKENHSVCGLRFPGVSFKRRRIFYIGGLLGSVVLASCDGFPYQPSYGFSADGIDLHRHRESVPLRGIFPRRCIFAFEGGLAVYHEPEDESRCLTSVVEATAGGRFCFMSHVLGPPRLTTAVRHHGRLWATTCDTSQLRRLKRQRQFCNRPSRRETQNSPSRNQGR